MKKIASAKKAEAIIKIYESMELIIERAANKQPDSQQKSEEGVGLGCCFHGRRHLNRQVIMNKSVNCLDGFWST